MLDVITVGSATVDAFVYTEKSELISVRGSANQEDFIAYPSGTKMLIKKLVFNTGGGGTNTAVAMSRMGLRTGYLGAIGRDENGGLIRKQLRREGVTFLGSEGREQTDFSVILNSIAHDRTILNYKGASTQLKLTPAMAAKLRRVQWIYCSSLVDSAYRTLEDISKVALKYHVKLAFNPSSYLAERGAAYLRKMLQRCHVLIMNREEAGDITGKEGVDEMLSALKEYGCEYAIITDGRRGVHAACGEERFTIIPHRVRVTESTGAGDAFASTFVAAIARGRDPKTALGLGMANAESVIALFGAKEGLLSWNALRAKHRREPYRIVRRRTP